MAEKDVVELELYLIRHGQSVTNAATEEQINAMDFNMREDPVLSEKGVYQAQKLGQRFENTDLNAVFSSCLNRAVLTAKVILDRQKDAKPLYVNPVFSEVHLPSYYRGSSIEELKRLCANVTPCHHADFSGGLIEGDENDTDELIQKRAARAVNMIRSEFKNGEKVAVVSHAGFITHMAFYLLGFRESLPDDIDISFNNASVTRIVFYKKGTHSFGSTVFRNVNDTAHLDGEYIT
ncbi:MAG: histidine phosphatase family protein [Clostridia bacterium]|nr:histidine phosphatase family protein [Clostridia bacterium]